MRSFFFSDSRTIVVYCACGAAIKSDARYRRRTCTDCQRARYEQEQQQRRADPITRDVRAAVVARDGMVCRYCRCAVRERTGRYIDRDHIELDHVIPVVAGGRSTVDNLVVSCMGCNKKKRGNVA